MSRSNRVAGKRRTSTKDLQDITDGLFIIHSPRPEFSVPTYLDVEKTISFLSFLDSAFSPDSAPFHEIKALFLPSSRSEGKKKRHGRRHAL